MGLDAVVYCDCLERGRLRTASRPEWGVHVDEEGGRSPASQDLDEQIAFDTWNHRDACEHEDGKGKGDIRQFAVEVGGTGKRRMSPFPPFKATM
jgi:hypothetical protein